MTASTDNKPCSFAAISRPIRDSNPCRRRERAKSTLSFAGILFPPKRVVKSWSIKHHRSDPPRFTQPYHGQHGGLTHAEMEIPLIAVVT